MTSKDAIFRELLYGSTLDVYMPTADDFRLNHLEEGSRPDPESDRDEDEYPWLIFRRVSEPTIRNGVVQEDIFEFEGIGLQKHATKGDDLLESMKDSLKTLFHGRKTYGKYDEDGNADPDGGLKMTAAYLGCTEEDDDDLGEKSFIMTIRFARPL